MTAWWAQRMLRFLRVPSEPHLPAGAPETARVFRAGHHFWTLKLVGWSIRQAFTLAGFIVITAVLHSAPDKVPLFFQRQGGKVQPRRAPRVVSLARPLAIARTLEGVAWAIWLVQLPITLGLLRLDYELRWYIVTDRAARLREGILNLREMTFTLANVQDIRIRQGPLQHALGLADVELRTAGGSESGGPGEHDPTGSKNLHLARFRGVANAEEIRDLVRERMKLARGAGLGDPDDPADAAAPEAAGLHAAARELVEESTRLREALARTAG